MKFRIDSATSEDSPITLSLQEDDDGDVSVFASDGRCSISILRISTEGDIVVLTQSKTEMKKLKEMGFIISDYADEVEVT